MSEQSTCLSRESIDLRSDVPLSFVPRISVYVYIDGDLSVHRVHQSVCSPVAVASTTMHTWTLLFLLLLLILHILVLFFGASRRLLLFLLNRDFTDSNTIKSSPSVVHSVHVP